MYDFNKKMTPEKHLYYKGLKMPKKPISRLNAPGRKKIAETNNVAPQNPQVSQKTMKELKKAYKLNYKQIGARCAYCGAYGNTRDHVIPLSFVSNGRPGTYKNHYMIDNIVRACSECNSTASNIVFDNFWEKKKYIAEMLEWKYRHILSSPDWTNDEIRELDGILKSYIKSYRIVKEFLKIRVENLNTPDICE